MSKKTQDALRKYYSAFNYDTGVKAYKRGGKMGFTTNKFPWGGPTGNTWIPEIDNTTVDESFNPDGSHGTDYYIRQYWNEHPEELFKTRGVNDSVIANWKSGQGAGTNWSGLVGSIGSIVGEGMESFHTMDAKEKDLSRRIGSYGQGAYDGITDNLGLIAASNNIGELKGIQREDIRDKSIGQDAFSAVTKGLNAGLSTGNIYVGLGVAAGDIGKSILERIKAGNITDRLNEQTIRQNAQLNYQLRNASEVVDNRNFLRAMQGYYNNPFEYALGGEMRSHGSDWNNGLTFINAGGRHEENPYEGVPSGVDDEGVPNLVEEGEVIWNDEYVFSDRLKVPKELANKYKLGGEKTFAEAIEEVTKESRTRPNDPISNETNRAIVNEFMDAQEELRESEQAKAAQQLQTAYDEDFMNQLATFGPQGEVPMQEGLQLPPQGMNEEGMPIEGAPAGFALGGNKFDDGSWKISRIRDGYNTKGQPIYKYVLPGSSIKYATIEDAIKARVDTAATPVNIPGYGKAYRLSNGTIVASRSEAKKKQKEINSSDLQRLHAGQPTQSSVDLSDANVKAVVTANRGTQAPLTSTQKDDIGNPTRRTDSTGSTGTGSTGSGLRSDIDYNRKLSAKESKEWEANNDYQAFLNYMRSNPNSPEAKQWMDFIQSEIKNSGSSYTLKDFDDWSRLAEDGKIGPVHQATLRAAQVYQKRANAPQLEGPVQAPQSGNRVTPSSPTETTESLNAAIEATRGTQQSPVTTQPAAPNFKYRPTWQRMAPVYGAGAAALYGMINRPDYFNADSIIDAARAAGVPVNIPVQTIGDYRTRNPFDERYLVNMANQNMAAGQRSLYNTSGGNRAMDMLGAMSLAHNNQVNLGEIMRQAYLANRQDDAQVAEFNRGTNIQNMNAINQRNLAQAQLNSQRQSTALSGLARGYGMRQSIKDNWDAATMQSLNSMLASLGAIGKENEEYNTLTSMAEQGYFPYYYGDKSILQHVPYTVSKNGGKLNKKKRRF